MFPVPMQGAFLCAPSLLMPGQDTVAGERIALSNEAYETSVLLLNYPTVSHGGIGPPTRRLRACRSATELVTHTVNVLALWLPYTRLIMPQLFKVVTA